VHRGATPSGRQIATGSLAPAISQSCLGPSWGSASTSGTDGTTSGRPPGGCTLSSLAPPHSSAQRCFCWTWAPPTPCNKLHGYSKKKLLETCWHFYSLTVRFGVRGVIALVVCHFQAARGGFGPRATRAMALGVVQNPPYIQDSSSCPHSNPKT
jgi:hypothetical protein